MADSRTLTVKFVGDTKSLETALGRAQKKTSTVGKALAVGAKVGAAGLLGLGVAAKIGFDEMADHQKVAAQTGAVLKSTGGAAHVSAQQVSDLANALLQKSGVDDEVIQSGENVLLTFRNIRNEAGKGNDIFNQATKATLDLSVALGKDMTSSSILVGKALNDPIKGMTALTRAGVQFNAGQTATIQHLVKTGQTMQAQKIILGELNKEFGGSAKAAGDTLPGQLSKLQESFKNLAGSIVATLVPSLVGVTSHLQGIVNWMQRNKQATQVLIVAFGALSVALIAAKVAYSLANSALVKYITSERVAAVASKALAAATWLVNVALDANPVVLITAGIIALGVALVIAWHRSQTFRNIVRGAMAGAAAAFRSVVGVVQSLAGWVQRVIGYVQSLISWISRIHVPDIPFVGGGASSSSPHPDPQHPVTKARANAAHVGGDVYLDGRLVGAVMRDRQRGFGRGNAGRSQFSPT